MQSREGEVLCLQKHLLCDYTGNHVEYSAVLLSLEEVKKLCVENLDVKSDSKLVYCQVFGEWKCKVNRLKSKHERAVSLSKELSSFNIVHTMWKENRLANFLGKMSALQ